MKNVWRLRGERWQRDGRVFQLVIGGIGRRVDPVIGGSELCCGVCGISLRASARFCDACGSPVRPSLLVGERKQVTVLFADVVGSMQLAAALDSERLREIMHELFNRSARVVQRYQGTVDKFTGDGLMALFGAPAALEDHALRACISALEIQAVASRLADRSAAARPRGTADSDWTELRRGDRRRDRRQTRYLYRRRASGGDGPADGGGRRAGRGHVHGVDRASGRALRCARSHRVGHRQRFPRTGSGTTPRTGRVRSHSDGPRRRAR